MLDCMRLSLLVMNVPLTPSQWIFWWRLTEIVVIVANSFHLSSWCWWCECLYSPCVCNCSGDQHNYCPLCFIIYFPCYHTITASPGHLGAARDNYFIGTDCCYHLLGWDTDDNQHHTATGKMRPLMTLNDKTDSDSDLHYAILLSVSLGVSLDSIRKN